MNIAHDGMLLSHVATIPLTRHLQFGNYSTYSSFYLEPLGWGLYDALSVVCYGAFSTRTLLVGSFLVPRSSPGGGFRHDKLPPFRWGT
jgi:hypothetical protein